MACPGGGVRRTDHQTSGAPTSAGPQAPADGHRDSDTDRPAGQSSPDAALSSKPDSEETRVSRRRPGPDAPSGGAAVHVTGSSRADISGAVAPSAPGSWRPPTLLTNWSGRGGRSETCRAPRPAADRPGLRSTAARGGVWPAREALYKASGDLLHSAVSERRGDRRYA